jgi:NADH-quinone oxidoreductase subunit L
MAFCFLISLFAPLIGAFIIGLNNKRLSKKHAIIIACLGITTSLLFGSFYAFRNLSYGLNEYISIASFITTERLNLEWSFYIDSVASIFIIFVTLVATVVHFYSIGYMDEDEGIKRFMAYLNFFTFSMLLLVSSANYVQMFIGWEGVGLCSYLLVGFWFEKDAPKNAAFKAFFMNRISDSGILFAICALVWLVGDLNIYHNSTQHLSLHWITIIGLAFFLAAIGKSAQIGLHTWLPDAMEGPTPVSALIHAATMVTAGVFLMLRLVGFVSASYILASTLLIFGATTAWFAGMIGSFQFDIKKSIAYSTCSQLGYMIAAIGALAPHAAIFHLTTHALFKALLFLGAGSAIHACSAIQDMRKMGGLRKLIPSTFFVMLIGSFSLCGIPPFSGYFSKESILQSLYYADNAYKNYAFWSCLFAAILTTLYTSRMCYLTFFSENRLEEKYKKHIHENSIMKYTIIILAALVLCSSFLVLFFKGSYGMHLLQNSFNIKLQNHELPLHLTLLIFSLITIIGVFSYFAYGKKMTYAKEASGLEKIFPFYYNFWRAHAYINEIYSFIFKQSYSFLSKLIGCFDICVLDRYLIEGTARLVESCGVVLQKIYTYNILIILIQILLGWILMLVYSLSKGIIL